MKIRTLIFLSIATLLFTGCAGIRDKVWKPTLATNSIPAHSVTNFAIVTNEVIVAVTNGTTITNIPTKAIQLVADVVYYPNKLQVVTNGWEERAEVQPVVNTVGTIANIAAPGIGTIFSTVAAAGLGLWGTWLNRKNKTLKENVQDVTATAVSLIQGVEQTKVALNSNPDFAHIAPAMIAAIQGHTDSVTGPILKKLVDATTGDTAATDAINQSVKA